MRIETTILLGFWALTGFAGLIVAAIGRYEATQDREVLGADADPVQRYLVAAAIRSWTGRMFTQLLILSVAGLSASIRLPAIAPDSPAGVAVRWALVLSLEMISAQLFLQGAVDLYAHWKARAVARALDG